MKYLFVLIAALSCVASVFAQNTLKAQIKDSATGDALAGASALLIYSNISAVSDSTGMVVINGIPDGSIAIKYSNIGYNERIDTLSFPLNSPDTIMILLESSDEDEELEEVVVMATRSSRTIANIPTRIEAISGEELDEKGNMKPGDIRMLLAESTGIQTQQTSATSSNAAIRIQGLDGKYTQMIRDGFPLYSGFSGGLGLLQVAPLDLKQVEVIKGSSSTLYGGGAIAGLVNLVSKTPTEERRLDFMANGTSALGLDASMFYAEKFEKIGVTLYTAYNHGNAYDPADIGLTAIPEFDRYTVNPKLWVYFNDKTMLNVGLNATIEKRLGGDIEYVKGNGSAEHSYFEENKTGRYSTQLQLDHKMNDKEQLTFKNSISYFDRSINMPAYLFSGAQVATYTEANYSRNSEKADWVAGINLLTDHFTEDRSSGVALRDYNYTTIGGFLQNTVDLGEAVTIESGIRGDYHNKYGFFFLPRVSALWKINGEISTRLGGGLGYKAPTIFTEEAERVQFRNVLPVDVNNTKAEHSFGGNYDINYRTQLFDDLVGLSINQMFFYTRINNPILLTPMPGGSLSYQQPSGNLKTKGMETNVKLTYGDFKLFVGYTLADVKQEINGQTMDYTLVSRNRVNNVLMYEVEDKWKIGAEAYYFSPQKLNDGTTGKSYWTTGLMVEKLWDRFSLFINFENLTDTRQTRFDSIYTGSITSPIFRDIYAPLDGFVVNGGLKIKL